MLQKTAPDRKHTINIHKLNKAPNIGFHIRFFCAVSDLAAYIWYMELFYIWYPEYLCLDALHEKRAQSSDPAPPPIVQ